MRLAVFASGTGSNFEAIHEAIVTGVLKASIELVVCDKSNALVVNKAKQRGIDVFCFNPRDYASKKDYERVILYELKQHNVSWIVLAGYMRLIGPTLLEQYPDRILNIHPSLLPKYKGLDALGQALENGDQTLGITVHYVDQELDGGKIIDQVSFQRELGQSREEVEATLHHLEHQLYVSVLKKIEEENR